MVKCQTAHCEQSSGMQIKLLDNSSKHLHALSIEQAPRYQQIHGQSTIICARAAASHAWQMAD